MSSSSHHPEQDEGASDPEPRPSITANSPEASFPPHTVDGNPTEHRQNPTRRKSRAAKRTRENAFWDLRRQLSRESVGAYANLLAEMNAPGESNTTEKKYNTTQNGIVIWTPQEKGLLFNGLDKKGKNGIKEIAVTIGSKSELEVQDYLRLLHRGLERQHLRDRHTRTVILGDVPAAAEVREGCDRVLDRYAELSRLEEQYLETVEGRKRHYDAWVIDWQKAEEIEEELEEMDDNDEQDDKENSGNKEEANAENAERGAKDVQDEEAEQSERSAGEEEKEEPQIIATNPTVRLTSTLLNMEKWIRLSERFFMNPGGRRLEDNWKNIAYPGENPSLTADAFADFYALTVSVTRRIIHSTLFFAMSRLRRMRDTGHRKAKVVKSRDVRSALDVLNMKQSNSDFWIRLARRCSLDVVDSRHRKGWKSIPMDHNAVEDYLSGVISDDNIAANSTEAENRIEKDTDEDKNSAISDVRSSSGPIPEEEQLYLSFEDEHAETLDQKASALEEHHLCHLLNHPTPSDLDPTIKLEDNEEPRRPTGERKTKEDLVDWRDRTLYRSEWEEYGNEMFDVHEDIAEDRRKRRRIIREEPIRLPSPVSVPSTPTPTPENLDESLATDTDVGHAVKHEARNGSDDDLDESVDLYEDEHVDQKPVISRENEELEHSSIDQSQEFGSEPDDSKYDNPARALSQRRRSPSLESEGSESMSGSDKRDSTRKQASMGRTTTYRNGSMPMDLETESEGSQSMSELDGSEITQRQASTGRNHKNRASTTERNGSMPMDLETESEDDQAGQQQQQRRIKLEATQETEEEEEDESKHAKSSIYNTDSDDGETKSAPSSSKSQASSSGHADTVTPIRLKYESR